MRLQLFFIIFSTFYYHCIRSEIDYRVVSYRGDKLPLYTGIYYGLVNVWSGYIHSNSLITRNRFANYPPPIDPQNATHWIKLRQNPDNTRNYQCVYANGVWTDGRVSRTWNRNYYDISFGCKGSAAVLTSQQSNYWSDCYTPSIFRTIFDTKRLWRFIEMPDYKLNAIMTDFQYDLPLMSIIKLHIKKVDLLHTSIITNDFPGTLTEKLQLDKTITQTFQITRTRSLTQSLTTFQHFTVRGLVGFKLFDTYDTNLEAINAYGWDWGLEGTDSGSLLAQTEKEIIYAIDKEVSVPAFTKVQIMSYVNYVENLVMKYKANITVTGIAPRFETDSRLDSNTIKVLLSKSGFAERLLEETPTSLTFETTGIFKGTFGMDSVFSATLIGSTRDNTTTTSTTTTTTTTTTTSTTTAATTELETESSTSNESDTTIASL